MSRAAGSAAAKQHWASMAQAESRLFHGVGALIPAFDHTADARADRSDLKIDEKINASSSSLPDGGKPSTSESISEQVNAYLASDVIPNTRKFLVESDKVLATCSSICSTIVVPALKSRARSARCYFSLRILISRVQATRRRSYHPRYLT